MDAESSAAGRTAEVVEAGSAGRLGSWKAVGVALFFGITVFFLYLRHQDFPAVYHRDEPSKVEQIGNGFRNLYHPLLMLETVELARRTSGADRGNAEAVARLGRTVSAAFMAAAVAALALAAGWRHSWGAGCWAGILAGIHFRFYDIAHYFKEDTAYLAGCAVFMAAAMYGRARPGWPAWVFLGLAAGMAASAKYAGLFQVALGAVLLWAAVPRDAGGRGGMFGLYLTAALVVVVGVHLQLLMDPEQWARLRGSFVREADWMVRGHEGVGQRVPHPLYLWQIYMDHRLPLLLLLLCLWPLRRILGRTDGILLGGHALYLAALSFTAKFSERYVLPLYLVLILYGAMAGVELWRRRPRSGGWREKAAVAAAVAFACWLFFHPVYMLVQTDRLFREDSRAALCAYLEAETPRSAFFATDGDIMLEAAMKRAGLSPRKIVASVYASDLGSIEELRARGVTHAVVSYDSFHRFVGWGAGASGSRKEEWERARAFYETLRSQGKLLWSAPPGFPKALHPGIELYALPEPR